MPGDQASGTTQAARIVPVAQVDAANPHHDGGACYTPPGPEMLIFFVILSKKRTVIKFPNSVAHHYTYEVAGMSHIKCVGAPGSYQRKRKRVPGNRAHAIAMV